MRKAWFLTVLLLLSDTTIVPDRAEAACYSCNVTAQGLAYCQSKSSGGAECYSNTNSNWCQTHGSCGGTGRRPEQPTASNRCGGARWVLVSVSVIRPDPQARFVLSRFDLDPRQQQGVQR